MTFALFGRPVVLDLWTAVGVFGQTLFASRFLVQWYHSEKKKRSVVPKIFWHLSLIGSSITILYGIARMDPVIIMGQFGFIVYIRNLMLYKPEHDNA